jgi:hypothetical protein
MPALQDVVVGEPKAAGEKRPFIAGQAIDRLPAFATVTKLVNKVGSNTASVITDRDNINRGDRPS